MSETAGFISQSAVVSLRLDKWLWVARFYKTRTLAQQAIDQGKVLLAGQAVKAARLLHGGEILVIYARGPQAKEVQVCALSTQRRASAEAQKLYRETPASLAKRQAREAERLLRPALLDSRPDRRTRRLLLEQKKTLTDLDS